jgi:hypothetical protein
MTLVSRARARSDKMSIKARINVAACDDAIWGRASDQPLVGSQSDWTAARIIEFN